MNNLLTHYPVNWIDGMKLSSSYFIAPYPCYSTWCWQWAIVNPAIKIEIENEKRR